jgi:fructokinase
LSKRILLMDSIFGGIEAGGTKFVCAVGSSPQDILAKAIFPTTTPDETVGQAIAFFREMQAEHGRLKAAGIASFGPVDLNQSSAHYGYITTTPKPGWADYDIVGTVGKALDLPIGFDTDVNGAALGEGRWGAAQGLDTFIYLTIGTGIGGGGLFNGRLMHGMLHPEMGHIRLPHDWKLDPYPGVCPYHGDCWEGMASGLAMEKRWGQRAESLPPDHPGWELEAQYIAIALVDLICTLSPQRIIVGGGVMARPGLLALVRKRVQDILAGYLQTPQVAELLDEYIVLPGLGSQAGVLGAIALAYQAADEQ